VLHAIIKGERVLPRGGDSVLCMKKLDIVENACAPLHALKPCFMPSYTLAGSFFSPMQTAHFLPLFLMPWPPVFRGPLPPAFFAISSRAFLSVANRQRLFAVTGARGLSHHNVPAAALSL